MSMTTVKPLGNRVLVKRSASPQTKGGILLPDAAKEKPKQGEVVAVGPGKFDEQGSLIAMHVKVGDEVLFSSYAGTEDIAGLGSDYLILSEEDILGVLVQS